MGSAYQISKRDNNGSLDTLGYKLFLSSEFSNISEELKYGLKHNKITFDNLVPMLEALLQLQHADYEIINLLILYVPFQPNRPNDRLKEETSSSSSIIGQETDNSKSKSTVTTTPTKPKSSNLLNPARN